jgi:hypothetical protein
VGGGQGQDGLYKGGPDFGDYDRPKFGQITVSEFLIVSLKNYLS